MKELVRSKHAVGEANLHLQFTPAYRQKIFAQAKISKLVRAYILAKAEQMKICISAIEFGPDHIHIFVANCRTFGPAQMANALKGFSARMMRKHHSDLFQFQLWGKHFWSAGYFYRSVGAITADAMQYYISHSQAKHWKAVDYDQYLQTQQKTLSSFTS